ncbi:MAG TPA: FoF1 ATP synthase subunit gamma [Verrucomicrobiae bacterium]|nr:FoF1 ATP synthase subunit gamma [Verrucomicrobiae bacterium]
MSKRRNLQERVRAFGDLRDVLESMKNLAMVEIGKLARIEPAGRHMLEELSQIASATASYHPVLRQPPPARLYVLVGSERGFCGDFNEGVARCWAHVRRGEPDALAIAVGSVLAERLAPNGIAASVAGPAIAEDLDRCLVELLHAVDAVEKRGAVPLGLTAIANGLERIQSIAVLPFEPPRVAPGAPPPDLNLPAKAFVREFVDRYADAALHRVFATSLLCENRARLAHMTVAIDRLDENVAALGRRIHRLRQEEITQEVESILLST